MLAYLRLPKDGGGLGSIAQVLAAEAIAVSEGRGDLISIRNRARELLLKTGSGTQAIGEEAWVWEVVRPMLRSQKSKTDMIAALGPLQTFDENRTIGELAKSAVNPPDLMRAQLNRIHLHALQEVLYVDKRTAEDFTRAQRKEPRLEGLIGKIRKAADFEALLGPTPC